MDRFFYYLLGGLAALVLAIGLVSYARNRPAAEPVNQPTADTAKPSPSPTATPSSVFGKPEMPQVAGAGPSLLDLPSTASAPSAAPTPLPWTPPNFGKVVTIGYPGFTVVYSVTLGNPLAVQYAMVGGAKPKRWPEPIKVQTPNPKLIPAAGYAAGGMALQKSITLYFGKQAGRNTELMTNICAFYPPCLSGPWSQFSEFEAEWAGEAGWIEVVAGPVFASPPAQAANGIVVPAAFYRAYRRSFGDTIAFLIPQTATDPSLEKYLTSISSIEAATGMSIFPNTITLEQRNGTAKTVW